MDEPHGGLTAVDDGDTSEHLAEPPDYPRAKGGVRVPERRPQPDS
ncbi:hypothetical protein APASM_4229 [Actinosynnema pretiosum subsp. pretiosum]|nr:hypothetical protein APASM_4229 [Actinosynnema pretiosum subsp. pretiosum]